MWKEVKIMCNTKIRQEIERDKIKYWQIADALGIHPTTLTCKLRKELPPEEKQRIRQAIQQIKETK